MTTILEKIDELRNRDKLSYPDYAELHDMASELLAKVEHVTAYLDGAQRQAEKADVHDLMRDGVLGFIRGIRIVMGEAL